MSNTSYEWYAAEVMGGTAELTANLNAIEQQGYEIFSVSDMLFPNKHGWMIVARKEALKKQTKPSPQPSKPEGEDQHPEPENQPPHEQYPEVQESSEPERQPASAGVRFRPVKGKKKGKS